jgi:predicted nucleic acid-binding protein
MIVADTSAFVSLAVGDVLALFLDEFDVVTTAAVIAELEETAAYDDLHGRGAADVLAHDDRVEVVTVESADVVTSRIDTGEASCVAAVRNVGAQFLITDDYRALPELQQLVDGEVALSPIVLRALVKRGALSDDETTAVLETIAEPRDWLGTPIYRYALELFD